ncbi:protein-lysine N-methyltransferase EEF2KMT [Nomia melanderi]|uniref:protein-lysine N-methyltransferase EEF2KMT n=1 Tax=Nomia melanderi TaxID=2448451 RepID=UPI0013043B17|nr:protein-lysine N-methyltransferase EEF2KMT [Nomia melanderi]
MDENLSHVFNDHQTNEDDSTNNMNENLFDVANLMNQFLCCSPIDKMDIFHPEESINCFPISDNQKEILDNTIGNDLIKKYPVKRSYQRAFLKLLMNKIEEEGGEIHDDLYNAYCNLISSPISDVIHYRHFLMKDDDVSDYITIQESTNIISQGTTGLCCWQGAFELSKWCMENKNEFHNKVVLEFGCGVGLTGLCIIKNCSPNRYIFTDFHKSVLEMACNNVKLNLLNNQEAVHVNKRVENDRVKFQMEYEDTNVEVMELNWEHTNEYLNEGRIVPDVIIGADIVYEPLSFNALVLALKTFLSFSNRYAIISGTIRNADTFSLFLNFLGIHGLFYEECSTLEQTILIQVTNTPVKVLRISQKRE